MHLYAPTVCQVLGAGNSRRGTDKTDKVLCSPKTRFSRAERQEEMEMIDQDGRFWRDRNNLRLEP